MKVYLVRHGQTEEHAQRRRQTPDSRLSREGKKQVEAVAKRLAQEEIDLIFSSGWPRARQTAEIIAEKIEKPLEFFDYIHEKEQHPDLGGAKWESRIHKEFEENRLKNWSNLEWKFKGRGESLKDVATRAVKFKKHLEKVHLGQNLLVISHGDFIRSFVAICVLDEDLKNRSFARFCRGVHINNTGLSLVEYKEDEKFWSIQYLNEHLHLTNH